MKALLGVMIATFCLAVFPPQAHAAKANKAKGAAQSTKEKLVLMPLRVPEEDKNLIGAMETALVEGLQQKYVVFSGEQVAQKAREIFMKESRNTAKKDCDETRCMQNIAEAFQAELIATANITKQDGGYFLALSIQNIFDNKVEYSKSMPCKNCDSFQVVEQLKELSGSPSPAAAPVVEEPQPKVNLNDPDGALWAEAQKGNTAEDYRVYLDTYPKGKYIPVAKARIKKLKDATQTATEQQEQQAWDKAQQENNEASYGLYLKSFPTGRFAGLAKVRSDKLKNDMPAKEEAELWNKVQQENSEASYSLYLKSYPTGRFAGLAKVRGDELTNDILARVEARVWNKANSSNDKYDIEAYLNHYPNGRYIAAANAKLKLIQENDPNILKLIQEREETARNRENKVDKEQLSYVSQGGLTWMPVTFKKSWSEANSYCANITLNGQTGWRLPTKDELSALYASGVMDRHGWVLDYTWSSTYYYRKGWNRLILVSLRNGVIAEDPDSSNNYVTCVR